MSSKDQIEDKIFFSKYKPEKKIGEGSFGKIYSGNIILFKYYFFLLLAINIHSNEKFALKLIFNRNNIILGKQSIRTKFVRIRSICIMLFKRR
jgi:hypothetical protein